MRLFQHPDFDQAIIGAAEHFKSKGLRPAMIEKDYYVTEILRIIAASGDKVIFKGGTSLLKGWDLIARFSEDIDIFLDPLAFDPHLGRNGINRELKKLRDAVAAHPGLTYLQEESQTLGGFGRNDRFSFAQHFGGGGEVGNRILLEAGSASGRKPTTDEQLHSYIGLFLTETSSTLGAEDETPFPMRLLHYRRTFVEKLFAIHGKVELLKRDKTPLGPYPRHYYDLFQLSARPEVIAMLKSEEYAAIKTDYDRISREHFEKSYFYPADMRFANSDALFPPAELSAIIAAAYEEQCKMLCYGPHPSWPEVQARFNELRSLL